MGQLSLEQLLLKLSCSQLRLFSQEELPNVSNKPLLLPVLLASTANRATVESKAAAAVAAIAAFSAVVTSGGHAAAALVEISACLA